MGFAENPELWTAIGFLMFGLVLIFLEILQPGFFIAVPGGALLIGGAIGIADPHLMFESRWAWVLWPSFFAMATVVNVWVYKRWAPPDKKPWTMSIDSLPGEEGEVTMPVHPDNMRGKVRIKGSTWSARSEEGGIPIGTRVVVVRAEGVHVIVAPLLPLHREPPAPPAA